MLACQSVLMSPQGQAALLRGGIVGCITKEYLSIDGVLDGPSVEVTAHWMGYIALSGNDNRFCDNHLTDNELVVVGHCSAWQLWVGIVVGAHKNLRVFWWVLIDQLIVLHSELIIIIKIMQIGQEMSKIFTLEVLASNLQCLFHPIQMFHSVFSRVQKTWTFLLFYQRLEWYEVNFKVEILKIKIWISLPFLHWFA